MAVFAAVVVFSASAVVGYALTRKLGQLPPPRRTTRTILRAHRATGDGR